MPRKHQEELAIEIGRIPVRLRGDGGIYERAVERYAPFVSSRRSGLPVRFHSSVAPQSSPVPFRFSLHGMSLHLSKRSAQFSGIQNEYGLDSLLRILLSKLLLPPGGFLLHAASILRDGKAYVFMGRSGAGKSTVAALSAAGSVLTDEISLLRRTRAGWRAYGTPFWGEFRADGQNVSAPVAGIFSLVQARANRRAAIAPREALPALLGNTLFFSAARADRERLLEIQSDCVARLPFYRLEFRKEETFWEAAA